MLARLVGLAARLAAGLVLLVLFTVSSYFTFSYWVRRGVTPVPELAGRSEEEAREVLVEHGLTPRLAEVRRFSLTVPEDLVLESRPPGGSLVKRGSRVEVVLSLGARRIVVPDLTGKSPAAARLTLEGEGLTVGPTLAVRSRRGPAGTVVGQEPPPGAELPGETDVALLVAQPESAPAWIMPDLVARRYESVRAVLEGAGFRFGSVTFEPYESVQPGTILRQRPLPGHPLRRESSIGLVVATDTPGAAP